MSQQKQRIEQVAGVVLLSLIAVGCFWVLRPFVTAILWAAILCYATWPVYSRLEARLRGKKRLAAMLMTAMIAVVLVVPFAVAGLTFADNVARLVQKIDAYRTEGLPPLPEWVSSVPLLGDWLNGYWEGLRTNTSGAFQTLKLRLNAATPAILSMGFALGRGIFQLAISVLIAYFFYRDGTVVVSRIREGIRRIAGDVAPHLLETAGATVKSVVYGLLGTALAQGIMAGIGFAIAGVPSPFLLGLLTFLLSLLPVGPPLVWVPATVWLFIQGQAGWGVFMGIWGLVAISGIDNIVRPMLISRRGAQPFALTFLGVLGGLYAFGFIGIFLGPTLLAAGYSLAQEFIRRKPPEAAPAAPAEGKPPRSQ